MKLLLDTHLLLWAAAASERMPRQARKMINASDNDLYFSAASLWEIVIKQGLGRADFQVDPKELRRGLTENGYSELDITSEHAIAVNTLKSLHKDPFDRLLIAQAIVEGMTLLSSDSAVSQYEGPVRKV